MAKSVLPTNFKDDVLDSSMNGKRRYVLIQNSDGTYSLDDATQYTQVGSTFGQAQINATNKAVNDSVDKAVVIDNISDIAANNTSGKVAGALALKELNRDFQNKMDKYYGAATLSIVDESSVLKYLILDADLIHHSHEISFSVIVNNLYFYSGIMYTDGGTTAWGQIQQRNAGNNAGNLFSFYFERGADPVLKKLGRSGTIAGAGAYWKDPPAGQYREWATGCVRWDGDNLVVTVEDDYEQGHLKVGAVVGKKGDTPNWGDKAGGLLVLKY